MRAAYTRTHTHAPRVERRFDRNDELRHDRQDLRAPLVQQIGDALHRDEPTRLLLFPQPVKEQRQVVVEVQLVNLHLPRELVVHAALVDLAGQVAALIEPTQLLRGRDA
jgi:hypothetical protein